ncbi:MAG: sensor histidine kinase [Deltaproteobacteria bacterium]|nr:sensor histidine kinase [Deltaproteobacteria bacterium]
MHRGGAAGRQAQARARNRRDQGARAGSCAARLPRAADRALRQPLRQCRRGHGGSRQAHDPHERGAGARGRPFFTTRSGADALGLGLAMCQRIARKHGGKIGISSAPGRGTTVRIELPAGAESERGRCSAPPVSGARRRGAAGGAVRHAGGWS